MRCPCKPSCQGPCAVEILKTAMFSQPKRPEGPPKQQSSSNVDAFTTIQHLEMLFKEHRASDILRSGFNDALVSPPGPFFSQQRPYYCYQLVSSV